MKLIRRNIILLLILLILISPIFGVILADVVGYHEPLDLAAELLGLSEWNFNWTPFSDYSVPGVDPIIGYILSGVIGVILIYAIGFVLLKLGMKKKVEE